MAGQLATVMPLERRIDAWKAKLPFLVNDPKRLDLEFYSGYDERFLSVPENTNSGEGTK
jgi:hypothetical protein